MDITIPIEDPSRRSTLFGTSDSNLRLIRSAFGVRVSAGDNAIHLSGEADAVRKGAHALEDLQRSLRFKPELPVDAVEEAIRRAANDGHVISGKEIDVYSSSSPITPRGEGQREYVEAIRDNALTFCLGPAGTGKTYLAVAVSVSLLKHHQIKRIVLARPAVEAGERLGFLPGDLQAKVNPYLRPLYDAMNDMMTFDQIRRFMQNDVIEVVPLAFMRGRTLNNAVVILDEAQNATTSQMLMFLTRLGHDSKMIVTGDESQSDLNDGEATGFVDAVQRLQGTAEVAVVRLSAQDIVRHPIVQRIVEAYGTNGRNV